MEMRWRLMLSISAFCAVHSSERLRASPSIHGSRVNVAPASVRRARSSSASAWRVCTWVATPPAPSSGFTTQRAISEASAKASGVCTPCAARCASVAFLPAVSSMASTLQPSQRALPTVRWKRASRPSVSGATSHTRSCSALWRATKSKADSLVRGRSGTAPAGRVFPGSQTAAETEQSAARRRSATMASRIDRPSGNSSSAAASSP